MVVMDYECTVEATCMLIGEAMSNITSESPVLMFPSPHMLFAYLYLVLLERIIVSTLSRVFLSGPSYLVTEGMLARIVKIVALYRNWPIFAF